MNIDAIIMLAAGAAFTALGFRPPSGLAARARLFRICGVGLLVIGGFLCLARPSREWRRQATDDGFASALFPGKAQRVESVDTVGSNSVARVSYVCSLPGEDITFQLSQSPIVGPPRNENERIDAGIAYFRQQGIEVAERGGAPCGDVQGFVLKLRHKDPNARSIVCLAVAHTNVYRVVASFPAASESKPEIRRFIESLQVRAGGPGEQPGGAVPAGR